MPGAPFNPTTGEHAHLGPFPARGTTLGLFQVIGDDPTDPDTADTHDNYVVCRGYESESDPEHQFLHDPYTAESTTPIMVAKPYGARGTFPYEQGQVIVAARIRNKLGYNAGKAETTVGQPADLDEEVVLLTDDDGVSIAWQDVGTPPEPDYDHCLAWWTLGDLDPCPMSGGLILSGRNGAVVMPSIQAAIMIPDAANNAKFALLDGGVRTLYNPLPFKFMGNVLGTSDLWCSHWGDGKFLLRGPTSGHIIGGSMPTTGTSLSGGFVQWSTGNSDGNGAGANGPFVGRVFEVVGGSPTEIVITATGTCTYRVTYQITVQGTTNLLGTTSRITTTLSGGSQVIGGVDQQMASDGGNPGVLYIQQMNGSAILVADNGDIVKLACSDSSGFITSVSGRITLEAILDR